MNSFIPGYLVLLDRKFGGANRVWCRNDDHFNQMKQDGNTISIERLNTTIVD